VNDSSFFTGGGGIIEASPVRSYAGGIDSFSATIRKKILFENKRIRTYFRGLELAGQSDGFLGFIGADTKSFISSINV